MARAENKGCVPLALGYYTLSFIEGIGALYLGYVDIFTAKKQPALMAGHMCPDGAAVFISPDKVAYRSGQTH